MIGIFDSGSGGLSVLGPLRRKAPDADIVYFADIKNLPYGDKTLAEIDALTYRGINTLLAHGATQILNACNTMSASMTLGQMGAFGVEHSDMIEMIGPTIGGLKGSNYERVAIIATRATIRSGAYQRGLDVIGKDHHPFAVPDLVPAIESGASIETIKKIVDGVIDVVVAHGCDAVLLGCTHFPLVRDFFEQSINKRGMNINVIDPAEFVTKEALRRFDVSGSGTTRFILSKDSSVFRKRASEYLGAPTEGLTEIDGIVSFEIPQI
ncbi:MAG: glutamate racemase [Patescibacteria group bacterium]|jgi:glutamate racemase|nr:glutamate racemase [Patescibacteria group bacterium]